MTPKLTPEMQQALDEAGNAGEIPVVDPATNTKYVLVRADLFEQMKTVADYDPRESYPFVDEVMRDDDERDPTLDGYQNAVSPDARAS